MTLIAAIACTDGVIIAADSASSDTVAGTKQQVEKIKQIGNQPILYAGSGDVGLLQKLDESLASLTLKNTFKRTRQEIKRIVVPELRESHVQHAPYPVLGFQRPPEAILLFVCVINKTPWILEMEKDGRDTCYNQELGDFAAMGSGKPWAQAVFRPHLNTTRDLKLGRIFAYRIMEDSIDLAAGNIAKPIHMYTISLHGTVKRITQEDIKSIKDSCESWRELEREAVGSLLATNTTPPPEPEPEAEIPQPLPRKT